MHPIFFSTSVKDVVFAEKVWLKFGSDLIYLYSKTGRQGAEFWEEIEREELPKCTCDSPLLVPSLRIQPGDAARDRTSRQDVTHRPTAKRNSPSRR